MTSQVLPSEVQVLEPYVAAGVFGVAEVQVVTTLVRAVQGTVAPEVVLGLALAVRAPLHGHVRAELVDVASSVVAHAESVRDDSPTGAPGGAGPDEVADEGAEDPLALPVPSAACGGVVPGGVVPGGVVPGGVGADPATGDVVVEPAMPEWPEPDEWLAILRKCPLVRDESSDEGSRRAPVVAVGTSLYLDRLHRDERSVADQLKERAGSPASPSAAALDALTTLFPLGADGPDAQHRAAAAALGHRLAVIAGGPGTGKTRTIARLLGAVFEGHDDDRPIEVALAAPTGKAAARLTEAVQAEVDVSPLPEATRQRMRALKAVTIHRLLGARPSGSWRHDAVNPITADVVVVDEVSMVDLPMAARLLDAVRPDARLVLVGDPSQLASVEAGAVLGDIVGTRGRPTPAALAANVVTLDRVHRFAADSAIAALAGAIDDGDADGVVELLQQSDPGPVGGERDGREQVVLVDPADPAAVDSVVASVVERGRQLVRLALAGDARGALAHVQGLQVLAARRTGPLGAQDWNHRVDRALSDAGLLRGTWSAGRPVMVTANDQLNGLFNGDVGVVVAASGAAGPGGTVAGSSTGRAGGPGRTKVAFDASPEPRLVDPSRLDRHERLWAMTIHKSQGSEFDRVVVTLPPPPSPILTRELLYTAVTRARQGVTIVASEAAIRAAVGRPVARSSGLAARLA